MISILKKELFSYFNSLIAYIVIIVFLAVTGIFTWIIPGINVFETGYSSLESLFNIGPWVLLLLIPAITMSSFAEEKRQGTIELLLTKPITTVQLILGKYLACLLIVLFSLIPTLIYYVSVYLLGSPEGNIDSAGTFGSYIGLIGLATIFCSFGIFASAISSNQIVSFVLSLVLCVFFFYGFWGISILNVWSSSAATIEMIGADYHYASLSKGLIDSRDVLYFVSVSVIMLAATKLTLDSKKW